MRELVSIFGTMVFVFLFVGCGASTIHFHDKAPKNQLAFLDTMHENDNHVTILKINGKKAGNKWDGSVGDHYVKYGKMTIFVQHHNNSYKTIGATELTFSTKPMKTYHISSYVKDAYIVFNVIENGKIITTKSIEVRYQDRTLYVPIFL